MPNFGVQDAFALDEASQGLKALERALGRRTARTTRSREDVNALRASVGAWFQTYRPRVTTILGDFPAIDVVDRELQELLAWSAGQMVITDLRAKLRAVARTIDRDILPAYEAARWTSAAAPPVASAARGGLAERLERVSPELASSYRQVHLDMAADRHTFLGPAGEIREVMRGAIHILAPDDDVAGQPWFVGHEGRPTQAERIRYCVQTRSSGEASAAEAAEIVDTKVGALGRMLYTRASRAFHAGTQRDELDRIISYVEAVLNEILP